MKKLLFMLAIGTVVSSAAFAHNGDKTTNNGDKSANNGDKTEKGATVTAATAKAKSSNRLEEILWTVPQSKVEKVDELEMNKAMVDLYKWYLQNETRIKNDPSLKLDPKDQIVAPFKVDPKVLQQYMQFIKKNFPGLNEDDLSDKRTASKTRKTAPVSTCDDLDSPMPLTASK
ncbi:hypothetical protein [Chitinophaga rhizosphaerae]|uniref:hypothetical protein n=1 Tax=Chitinophaga rhizosphaerae TaxID=1864947 RepID=UPI000F80AC57|nr:hypothetical protein [Chitinophaga rhizosphaerae]